MKVRPFACRNRGGFMIGIDVDLYVGPLTSWGYVAIGLGFWAVGVKW